MEYLEQVLKLETAIRRNVGAGSAVLMTDKVILVIDRHTSIVAQVRVTPGDPDSVLRSLYGLLLIVSED